MLKRRSSFFILALCAVLAILVPDMAGATGNSMLLRQIKETIVKTRTDASVDARTSAAQRLAVLARKIDPKEVDDQTLAELVSLLDTSDDSVRYWVATALGNLGSRAGVAIPKLEKILPAADCLNGAMTSASAIRHALTRMGVKPPPRPKCGGIAG
jgi:hypothetical protein